jgi:hypothetical protein
MEKMRGCVAFLVLVHYHINDNSAGETKKRGNKQTKKQRHKAQNLSVTFERKKCLSPVSVPFIIMGIH